MRRTLLILAVLVLAGGGVGWWYMHQQRAYQYADALALCERDPVSGSAKIDALDQLHGEEARPAGLRSSLATCGFNAALDRVEYYNDLAKALR